MVVKVFTATLNAITPQLVEVEAQVTDGIPSLVLIGLASKTLDEAKDRIISSLKSAGVKPRGRRTVVNLAPADLKKTGSSCEVAIAVSLIHLRYTDWQLPAKTLFLGELSLDGQVRPIKGLLALALAAKSWGFTSLVFPACQSEQLATITGLSLYPLTNLSHYVRATGTKQALKILEPMVLPERQATGVELGTIRGQLMAKRALELSAAGGHHLFLVGPPGVGKSLLARSLPTLLPPLTPTETLEVAGYASCLTKQVHLTTDRPFRAPHHSISRSALIGGTPRYPLGEITFAHRGVLFLDECAELARTTLDSLRQPLEDGFISSSQAGQLPAQFTLVAASNPCPCGYADSRFHACRCLPYIKQQYQQHFSGPFLDRIELFVRVNEQADCELLNQPQVTSAQVREQVCQAHERQLYRFRNENWLHNNQIVAEKLGQYCQLQPSAQHFLDTFAGSLHLSARAYHKVLRVARTIADLTAAEKISELHLAEAFQYRQENCLPPATAGASPPGN